MYHGGVGTPYTFARIQVQTGHLQLCLILMKISPQHEARLKDPQAYLDCGTAPTDFKVM